MLKEAKYRPVGDRAILIEFENHINLETNKKVHTLNHTISRNNIDGVEECVPTYRSLLVYYNPLKAHYEELVFRIKDLETGINNHKFFSERQVLVVPVIYGGEFGPDLSYVAEKNFLTETEVVKIHSEKEYTVYMIGFIAGFPYLGEVDDKIATPRLKTPRIKVLKGSVGIADKQTGIYPAESPGGWQIIGRTPLNIFDPKRSPPNIIQPGDIIKFEPITHQHLDKDIKDEAM